MAKYHIATRAVTVCIFMIAAMSSRSEEHIRVLIWDEQQPTQKKVYPNFLGNQIASFLTMQPGLDVRSVKMDDPEQGLTNESLDKADVLIWWGHVRNAQVSVERAKNIVERIKAGKLQLIALHSAHWSEPFVQAMRARAIEDALKKLSDEDRKTVIIKADDPKRSVPKRDAPLTPSSELKVAADGSKVLEIKLPLCVFPAYRADGMPSHLTTVKAEHPIARGIPAMFDIAKTEMYDEPFHVPAPDDVIFEEKWDKGEHFRAGMVWNVGKGKVFYFRPGHEIFGVFNEEIPLKIVANAVRWMGEKK